MCQASRGGYGALKPPAGMSAESRRWSGRPGPGSCRAPIWPGIDYGGDRDDLRRVQSGGIKAAEKAPRTVEGLCQMTEPLNFFYFSGLQTASECPDK